MNSFPPPSSDPVVPRPVDNDSMHTPKEDGVGWKTVLAGALLAIVVAGGLILLFRDRNTEGSLAPATPTTAAVTATSQTVAPATVVTASTLPASSAAPPSTAAIATTDVPPTVVTAPTTEPPATTAPSAPAETTTHPPAAPQWWDIAYTIDCGNGARTFTLVDGFFADATPNSELYFELSREVYPFPDGSVILKAACFTGGDVGITVFLLGLPDGTSNSAVSLSKNALVAGFDGATLTVETFDDTMQPPPVSTYQIAVVNGLLAFVG